MLALFSGNSPGRLALLDKDMSDGKMDAEQLNKSKTALGSAKTAIDKLVRDAKLIVNKLNAGPKDDLYETMNLDLCALVCSCILFCSCHTHLFARANFRCYIYIYIYIRDPCKNREKHQLKQTCLDYVLDFQENKVATLSFELRFLPLFLQAFFGILLRLLLPEICSCGFRRTRKQLLMELSTSQSHLEHVLTFQELPNGSALSFALVKGFLQEQQSIAVSATEKLAGCQARMRTRGS